MRGHGTSQVGNKLIAEFMGYKLNEDDYYLVPIGLPQFRNSDHGEWCSQQQGESYGDQYWEMGLSTLDYNNSMDWLNTVLDKIRTLPRLYQIKSTYSTTISKGFRFEIWYDADNGWEVCKGHSDECELDAAYESVIKFIEYFNKDFVVRK
jgi:hypothetical protein